MDVEIIIFTDVGFIDVWRFLRSFVWQLTSTVMSLQLGWLQIWLDHLVFTEVKASLSFKGRVSQKVVEMLG